MDWRLLVLVLTLAAGGATAQEIYRAPRDAYGHPILEGVWSARWLTTLERPDGTPLVLTPAEGAERVRAMLTERARNDIFDEEIAYPDATTLAIVRGEHRGSLIVDPPNGKLPLTATGRAALAAARVRGADGPESRPLGERCLAGNGRPGMLIAPSGMLKQVLQTRDHVLILSEGLNELRILAPGAGRQEEGMASWHGAPTAHWEDEALVIESTGFRSDDKTRQAPFSRFPIRPQTKVIERFTRIAPNELLYEFSVDDPVLYSRPWRAEYAMVLTEDRIFEFACHEGNYSLANILSGARAEERQALGSPQP